MNADNGLGRFLLGTLKDGKNEGCSGYGKSSFLRVRKSHEGRNGEERMGVQSEMALRCAEGPGNVQK